MPPDTPNYIQPGIYFSNFKKFISLILSLNEQPRQPNILFNRYIIAELFKNFFALLVVFTAVLVITQIMRISETVVTFGFSVENILLPILFIILPMLSMIIPIAFFFASLVTFTTLNNEGEFAALQAAGYSLMDAGRPLFLFSGALFVLATISATNLESWGRRELLKFYYQNIQTRMDNMIKVQLQPGIFFNDFVGFVFYAEEMNENKSSLKNIILAPNNKNPKQKSFTIFAPRGSISGTVASGDLSLVLRNGHSISHEVDKELSSIAKFNELKINLIKVFPEKILGNEEINEDYRTYTFGELASYIDNIQKNNLENDEKFYLKARYLFHQRIGVAFVVIVFGIFGMIFGIHEVRKGKNSGFRNAIIAIVLCYIVIMGFKWLSEQGHLPAPFGVWIPNALLFLLAIFCLYQKNRLPPSESLFAKNNLPLIGRN